MLRFHLPGCCLIAGQDDFPHLVGGLLDLRGNFVEIGVLGIILLQIIVDDLGLGDQFSGFRQHLIDDVRHQQRKGTGSDSQILFLFRYI